MDEGAEKPPDHPQCVASERLTGNEVGSTDGDDVNKAKRKRSVGRKELDDRLKGVSHESDECHQWFNDRLRFAFSNNLVTAKELRDSLTGSEKSLKRYLSSLTDDESLIAIVRKYAIACSKLHVRLGALMNAAVAAHIESDEALLEIAAFSQDANRLANAVIPGNPKAPEFVRKTVEVFPSLDELAPSAEDLSVMCCWNQGEVSLARRFVANTKVHVRVHFTRRLKKLLRDQVGTAAGLLFDEAWGHLQRPLPQGIEEELDAVGAVQDGVISKGAYVSFRVDHAMRSLFGGVPSPIPDDEAIVAKAREDLDGAGCWDAATASPAVPSKSERSVPPRLALMHFRMATAQGFAPFPSSACTSRVHVQVDQRVMNQLMCHKPLAERDLLKNFNLTPELWNARRRRIHRKADKSKRKKKKRGAKRGFRKVAQARRRLETKLHPEAIIRSICTDGMSATVVMKIPHKRRADNLTKKDWAAIMHEKSRRLLDSPGTMVVAVDPGRRNLVTAAGCLSTEDPMNDRPRYAAHSRGRWKKRTRHKFKSEWEAKRREAPDVKAALDALSQSGGRRGTSVQAWQSYLSAATTNKEVLYAEFLENDERAKLKMEWYRGRRRAVEEVVMTVLKPAISTSAKRVLVGYGSASMASHGRGPEDISVPTKEIKAALNKGIKKHGLDGIVRDVWEFRTTKTCYRCKEEMEKVYMRDDCGELLRDRYGKKMEDLNFRRCTHCPCHDERPKLRNRDFNAAINIMLAFLAELRGEERPAHLKPRPRIRRSTGPAKKKARRRYS